MENFVELDVVTADLNPFQKVGTEWFLLTAGNLETYNMMTCSWGMMGVLWNKNIAVSVVRPQRHTKKFVDANELFTLSFFGKGCRKELGYCGSHSGANCDKMHECGLTAMPVDGAVSYTEAETILVCRKLYAQTMTPESFLDKTLIPENYPDGDFHTAYVGEILKAYRKK